MIGWSEYESSPFLGFTDAHWLWNPAGRPGIRQSTQKFSKERRDAVKNAAARHRIGRFRKEYRIQKNLFQVLIEKAWKRFFVMMG